ncbi:MAG: RecQ family ATP-dependent DNA helicase [Caldilineaceae bacterium]|nr:RecQ family ATP-dependent DNA helicase [Caldilineaceae bacterium]
MPASLLTRLALEPAQMAALPGGLRRRILRFLLRWEAYEDALACLDSLAAADQLAVQDLRADALHGLGDTTAAINLLWQRMRGREDVMARLRLAELLLAMGDLDRAASTVAPLAAQGAAVSRALYLQGLLLLRQGDSAAAESTFIRLARAAPESRYVSLGLMQLYRARGDMVRAAAHAVQALGADGRGDDLAVEELSELRAFFAATQDTNQVRAINQSLISRFDRELAELREGLARVAALDATVEPVAPAIPELGSQPLPSTPAPSAVAVTAAERRALEKAAWSLFGFTSLLPHQADVMASTRRGEHVLAILPTGAGKSLCYQLPALMDNGVTLVVSPLIALMKDQVDGLPDTLRAKAVAINSQMDGDDLRRTMDRVATGAYRLVYAAPERLRQPSFLAALRRAGLVRLVVDEAHCVSVWGHDFRPDYLHLARAHRDLGLPPLLAMTATAPPRVRTDIERQLLGGEGSMRVIAGDTFRSNLHLSAFRVRDDDERVHTLVECVRALPGCGIVYARSRARCEELAALLISQGVAAVHYHAGISDRAGVQDRFMRGDVRVIVATIAFGMGVDKRDIRFIVHYGLPGSVEGYYQEIGRAGRDGEPAYCVLLYGDGDQRILLRLAARNALTMDRLRGVYSAVQNTLGERQSGAVPADALTAAAGDETAARVAVSLLEQVRLLRRHYDVPRALTIQRPRKTLAVDDPSVAQFLARTGLDRQPAATGTFEGLVETAAIEAEVLEEQLLAWQEAGYLRYYPQGRNLFVTLLPAPANAGEQLESLLRSRAAIDQQRIREMAGYAQTTVCRHGYLAGYLGSQPRQRCNICDNCGAQLQLPRHSSRPDFERQALFVLEALHEQSWGRRNLIRLLRGDAAASERAQQSSYYGALREREEQSLAQLVESLQGEGLIQSRELEHGGMVLELTAHGRKALRQAGASGSGG